MISKVEQRAILKTLTSISAGILFLGACVGVASAIPFPGSVFMGIAMFGLLVLIIKEIWENR